MPPLVGQVPREVRGRDAFQELDYAAEGSTAKWAVEAGDAADPDLVARAFATAVAGRPGPVVLGSRSTFSPARPTRRMCPAPPPSSGRSRIPRLVSDLLAAAERPVAIVGEGGWTAETGRDVVAFAEAVQSVTAAEDYVDNRSRAYAGHLNRSAPTPRRRARARRRPPARRRRPARRHHRRRATSSCATSGSCTSIRTGPSQAASTARRFRRLAARVRSCRPRARAA